MFDIKKALIKILCLCLTGLIIISIGCTENPQETRLRQFLSSINWASGEADVAATAAGVGGLPAHSGSTAPASISLPGLPTLGSAAPAAVTSTAIVNGTPRVVKEGFCGDGVINGSNEDCDGNAIQDVKCSSYGGVPNGGEVTCQPNTCLYDISKCITPEVDALIGGSAETCKCTCSTSLCRGGCTPTAVGGQSLCRFDCDNECVCRCEGKMEAHIESCEFRGACSLDAAGNPACEFSLDQCEILTSIVNNIATVATSRPH